MAKLHDDDIIINSSSMEFRKILNDYKLSQEQIESLKLLRKRGRNKLRQREYRARLRAHIAALIKEIQTEKLSQTD